MKKLLFIFISFLGIHFLSAQAPNHLKYQAVARDHNGNVITGPIEVRLSFLKDESNGSEVYVESHTVTTNPQGVFDLTVGKGSVVNGSMDDLQWSAHEYWMMIELKTPGNVDFVEMGRSQLLSVPYALYAADADVHLDAGPGIGIQNKTISAHDESPDNEIQTISLTGNELSLSHNGGKVILPEGGSENWSATGNTIYNSPNNYRVAIGSTQSNDAKFSVVSDGADFAGKFSSTGMAALVGTNSGAGQGVFGGSTDGIGGVFSSINSTGGFFSSANGNALVASQGNVGIGIIDPEYQLHVNGTSYIDNDNGPALLVGDGNIGIGTANPTYKLSVVAGPDNGIFCSSEEGRALTVVSESNFMAASFFSTYTPAGFFSSLDDHCIVMHQGTSGTPTNNQGLLLKEAGRNWNMYVDIQNDLGIAYNNNLRAWIYDTDGSYHNSSDRSLKKNISPKTNVLPGLMQLQAYTYHMKTTTDDSPLSLGFMADEVEAVFPELVREKEGSKSLCYDHFAVLSVEAIKEQQTQIEELKSEVAELRLMVQELKSMIPVSKEK